ncbi:MAG: hypothetical protein JO267_04885 [Alphaproteobacteria bacterium]|nr:hypothetical protein [Alphaproteobacteria bacterium]
MSSRVNHLLLALSVSVIALMLLAAIVRPDRRVIEIASECHLFYSPIGPEAENACIGEMLRLHPATVATPARRDDDPIDSP